MLKRLSERELIAQLLAEYGLRFQQAFLEAVDEVRSKIVLTVVAERLERHDIAGAIRALGIEHAAFRKLEAEALRAMNAGGNAAVLGMPILRDPNGSRVIIRYDIGDPVSAAWARAHSAELVQGITADALNGAQIAIERGLAEGRGPRSIALDIAGRVNRVTGRREGSRIGLTSIQSQYVSTARAELLSGDPKLMRNYLTRGRRNKRFDRAVQKAIADGKPVDATMVAKATGAYSDGLLQQRAETIARTETQEAVQHGKFDAFRQAAQKAGYLDEAIIRRWDAVGDKDTRHSHMTLNKAMVRGLSVPFVDEGGSSMMFPGDRSMGADPASTINCRCDQTIYFDPTMRRRGNG